MGSSRPFPGVRNNLFSSGSTLNFPFSGHPVFFQVAKHWKDAGQHLFVHLTGLGVWLKICYIFGYVMKTWDP